MKLKRLSLEAFGAVRVNGKPLNAIDHTCNIKYKDCPYFVRNLWTNVSSIPKQRIKGIQKNLAEDLYVKDHESANIETKNYDTFSKIDFNGFAISVNKCNR